MRRLLALSVVLAVLAVCAPSYGYILVYKVTGSMKVQEWVSDTLINVSVKGYLVMDINDSDKVTDAKMVLYGKDASGNLIYYEDGLDDPNRHDNAYWGRSGNVVGLDVWNYIDPFYYEFTMTGTLKAIDVGLVAAEKRMAASSLKGSLACWSGPILDINQDLFGSGIATMTLDTKQTKTANAKSSSVNAVISEVIVGLGAKNYHQITL